MKALGAIKFRRLEAASFVHSLVFAALLICAFALNKPEPATFVFGMAHGLMWIGMSLICIAAALSIVIASEIHKFILRRGAPQRGEPPAIAAAQAGT